MTEKDFAELLADAAAARAADIARLADLSPDQLDYLAHVHELPDPITDGKGCVVDDEVAAAADSFGQWTIEGRHIVVQLVPDHSDPPVEVWTAVLQRPVSGSELPLDVMAELKLALESDGAPPPYILDSRRSYTEWGASGVSEVVTLVVAWSLSGVIGNATYDALRSAVVRLTERSRDERSITNPLDQGEAVERGRWAVRGAFEMTEDEADELVPVATERRGEGWVVRYRRAEHRYEAELLEEDGLVVIARVGWASESAES
jgi:hypothetical protein